MKKKIIKALLSNKRLKKIKKGLLNSGLKRLVKTKKLKSKDASDVLTKLGKQLMKEKKRVKKFMKKEVRREVRKAAPHVQKLVVLGTDSAKCYINKLLNPKKGVRKRIKRRVKRIVKTKLKPKKIVKRKAKRRVKRVKKRKRR